MFEGTPIETKFGKTLIKIKYPITNLRTPVNNLFPIGIIIKLSTINSFLNLSISREI
jgi:hypothetical protein